MKTITINIEKSDFGYQGWLEYQDTKIYFENESKKEMINSAKEQVEDYLKHEGKHLNLNIKDIQFYYKFI
jgi:hypothetical protein